jgi:sugar O-acyltransferase (sialic acid O-acetyltransferase NeuD family)
MDFKRLTQGDETVVVGTGGFAVELAGLLNDVGIEVRGCIGPDAPSQASALNYLGDDEKLSAWIHLPMIVGIGKASLRQHLFDRIVKAGGRIAGFIHPQSCVSSKASIAEGVIVYPQATVHSGVSLGRGAFVNSNASVGHETSVGAFVNIGPGASLGGRVSIGEGVYIGIGACTIEGIVIAAGAVLGAGAIAVRDCDPCGTYVGVPARRAAS